MLIVKCHFDGYTLEPSNFKISTLVGLCLGYMCISVSWPNSWLGKQTVIIILKTKLNNVTAISSDSPYHYLSIKL